jgi:hypothetical protein
VRRESALAACSRVHDVEVGVIGLVLGAGWAVGYEAYGADDHHNAGAAREGEMFVQPEAAEQGDDDVAECGGGHDEGEVGPTEGGHVAGEEADEQDDSGDDPRVGERVEQQAEVLHVDLADLGHAVGEEGVADTCRERDAEEDEVALRG